MKNKIVALLLIISIFIVNMTTSAFAYYIAGPTTYYIQNIELSAGEEKNTEFYLPFDSNEISFDYEAQNDFSITVDSGEQKQTQSFPSGKAQGRIVLADVERSGEKIFKITSTEGVALTNVGFSKAADGLGNKININTAHYINLTENEKLLHSTVLINSEASAIIVNGGKRYINNQDVTEKPLEIDGSIHLPARVLALALGYYYESIPSSDYILLRNTETSMEYYFSPDNSYAQSFNGTKEPIGFIPFYKNGKPYLPIRFFAENLGKTVGYRDGIVVIDDKYTVSDVINNDAVFEYVSKQFSEFTAEPVKGKVYHVAKTGCDVNEGTKDAPLETLAEAGRRAKAGDTVIIHEGIYREILAPQNNGTATSPIVFKAAQDENVTISAADEVSGFTDCGNGLVSADIDWNLGDGRNQMFINNECIIEARYPNAPGITMSDNGEELSSLFPVEGDFKVNDDNQYLVESSTLLQEEPALDFSGGTYVSMHGYGWTLSTAKIDSSEKGKLHLTNLPKAWWFDPSTTDRWDFGYISGHKNAIDLPGEWVIENNKILMKLPDEISAENLTVEMKKRQLVLDLRDRKYIKVEGINTIGGGVKMNNSIMCTLDGMNMKYISHYTYSDDQREGFIDDYSAAARRINGAKGAPARGEVGIYIGGSDNIVINSTIDHSAAAGLYLVGSYAYIENNIIKNCGYMGSYVAGITISAEPWKSFFSKRGGASIYNNTVYNAGRNLLLIQSNEHVFAESNVIPFLPFEIAYNDFHDGLLFSQDAGLIYTFFALCATDKLWSKLHDNYIYYTRPESSVYSAGIYNDNHSIGINSYNNVIFNTEPKKSFAISHICCLSDIVASTISNNSTIREAVDGPMALKPENFPLGKPFYAGTLNGLKNFTCNLHRLDETTKFIRATDGELSDEMIIDEKNRIVFTSADQFAKYNDIDFGNDCYDIINVYYTSDRYKEKDSINFELTNEANESDSVQMDMDNISLETNDINCTAVSMYPKTGKWSMSISMPALEEDANVKILGFGFGSSLLKKHNGGRVVAGYYDAIIKRVGKTSNVHYMNESYVKDTHPGTILLYKNVKINDVANILSLQLTTAVKKQKIEFMLNDPDSIPFMTAYGKKDEDWLNFEPTYINLIKPLQSGTYDIYVRFSEGETSNFLSFGFLNSMP